MTHGTFERAVRDWLDDGSDRTPRPAIDAVLLAVKTTPQQRTLWSPRRFTFMQTYTRLAAIAALVAVAGIGAIYLGGAGARGGPQPRLRCRGSGAVPSCVVLESPRFGMME